MTDVLLRYFPVSWAHHTGWFLPHLLLVWASCSTSQHYYRSKETIFLIHTMGIGEFIGLRLYLVTIIFLRGYNVLLLLSIQVFERTTFKLKVVFTPTIKERGSLIMFPMIFFYDRFRKESHNLFRRNLNV